MCTFRQFHYAIFLFKCSTCVNQLLIKCSTHVHPLLTTFLIGLSISPKKRASFRRFPSLRKLHLLYHIEHRSSMPLSCQHIGGVGVVSLLCPPSPQLVSGLARWPSVWSQQGESRLQSIRYVLFIFPHSSLHL